MLGIAVTGMMAAFMAGVAANVTAFNTVVTYDLIQAYFVKDRDSAFYLRAGRLVTIVGILISVATAFIAKGYSNIMNYIQTLFSIFNAPLFATFIIAMFWKRATAWGGFFSLVAGTAAAYATNRLAAYHVIFHFGSALSASFWQAIIAFLVDAVVMVAVSLVTKPKPRRGAAGAGLGDGPGQGRRGRTSIRVTSCGGARRPAGRRRDRDARSSSTSSSPRRPGHGIMTDSIRSRARFRQRRRADGADRRDRRGGDRRRPKPPTASTSAG